MYVVLHLSPSHLNLFCRGNYYINKWLHGCAKIFIILKQNAYILIIYQVPTSKIPWTKNFTFVNYSKPYILFWHVLEIWNNHLVLLQYKNHAGWLKCKTLASSPTPKMRSLFKKEFIEEWLLLRRYLVKVKTSQKQFFLL